MQGYRAYIIGSDGHIRHRVDLVCDNEADAKERTKALVDGFDVELWQFDKLIERFKGKE
jgi:hypothetical protein